MTPSDTIGDTAVLAGQDAQELPRDGDARIVWVAAHEDARLDG